MTKKGNPLMTSRIRKLATPLLILAVVASVGIATQSASAAEGDVGTDSWVAANQATTIWTYPEPDGGDADTAAYNAAWNFSNPASADGTTSDCISPSNPTLTLGNQQTGAIVTYQTDLLTVQPAEFITPTAYADVNGVITVNFLQT
jgi:hypothetical protein